MIAIITLPDFIGLFDIKVFFYRVIFLMLVTTIALLFALAAHAVYVEFREKRFKKLLAFYEEAVSKKFANNFPKARKPVRRPRRRVEYDALSEVLSRKIATASGETEERLKDYARELGVDEFYEDMASSRSWSKRFIALEHLGLLKLPEMGSTFYRILENDKNLDVLAKAIWAISFVLDETDLDVINRILDRPYFMSAKFAEYIYINIIESFRHEGKEDKFLSYLKLIKEGLRISNPLKRAIIEACGSCKLYSAKGIIMEYFKYFNDVPEMRIACIRAIGELGTNEELEMMQEGKSSNLASIVELGKFGAKDELEVIRSGLSDADWRVRAVAAKSASSCSNKIIRDLRTSLYDSNYNVRMNAAKSLSMLGNEGTMSLAQEADSNDRFVRDITRYMLKELSLHV